MKGKWSSISVFEKYIIYHIVINWLWDTFDKHKPIILFFFSMSQQIAALGGKRPFTSTVILVTTAFVTFNGGIWQLMRRRQKERLVNSFDNMKKDPLTAEQMPKGNEPFREFSRVDLHGYMDNEGGTLVGPRPMPASRQALDNQQESRRGGFMLLTPFQIEGTNQVIMVNRGWVPIDACKSRMQRVQYSGEGFLKYHLTNGVIRQEEWLQTTFGGDAPENHKAAYLDKFWAAVRPWDIAKDYYKKRYGEENVEECVKKYGAQHYFIETFEDHSGKDQILINDKAYPMRRTAEDLTRTNLSPAVHLMYSLFWFFVSAGNIFILRRMWLDRVRVSKASRLAGQAAEVLAAKRRSEGQRLESELSKLQEAVHAGNFHELRMGAVKAVDLMNTTTQAGETGEHDKMMKEAMGVQESASPYEPPKYRTQQSSQAVQTGYQQQPPTPSPTQQQQVPVEAAEQQKKVENIVKEQQQQQQQVKSEQQTETKPSAEGKSSKKKKPSSSSK